jgi:hypothetical protein
MFSKGIEVRVGETVERGGFVFCDLRLAEAARAPRGRSARSRSHAEIAERPRAQR